MDGLVESRDPANDLIPSYRYLGVDFELTLGPYVEMSSKLGVILDFDGTLSYLAPVRGKTGKIEFRLVFC